MGKSKSKINIRIGWKKEELFEIDPKTKKKKKTGEFDSPRDKSLFVVKEGVKKFDNCMHRLAKIRAFDRLFLDYLCESMEDETNVVITNIHLKKSFLQLYTSSTGESRSLESVKKAIGKLKQHHLIIDFGQRDVYMVNPRHFFKGPEQTRKALIQKHVNWVFSESKENDLNFKEAFGITDDMIKMAKGLRRINN